MWGVGDLTGGNNVKPILSVKNKDITSQDVLNELNKIRYNMPQRPSLEDAIKTGLLNTVLDKFEQEILINSEANSLNLFVPKDILTKAISSEKAFRDPLGKFSQTKFLKSLNNAGLSESKYIEMINTEAYFKQLSMPFSFNTYYSDKITNKIIEWQNETRDIEYVFLKKTKKESLKKPSKVTLKNFYNKNKKTYKIPVTRNIKYIEINPANFNSQINVDEKQIINSYNSNKSRFITEERRQVYQIVTQDITKANNFAKKIELKDDFTKFAKKDFGLEISDIDIGFVNESDLPLSSRDIVFKAKTNDIIGPVKSNFGYIVYKLISVKPKTTISYKEAFKQIKRDLINEQSIEVLYQKIDVLDDLIAEGNNLTEINKTINLNSKIKEINKISKNGIIYSYRNNHKQLNKTESFLKAIWKANINEISEIIELPNDSYALIEIAKENKETTPNFKEIEKKILKEWVAEQLILKTELELKKSIKSKDLTFKVVQNIKRGQKNVINEIKNIAVINQLFELKQNKLTFINGNEGSLAVKVINSKTAPYKINKKKLEELNLSLSKSFFNDFSKSYIELLATKNKLKRNYNELENYLGKIETN